MTDEQTSFSPPQGWVLQTHHQTFSSHAGPYYFREEGPEPGVGFFSEPHHANLGGVVHGGALMTLADMSLFDVAFRHQGEKFRAVTVTFNSEFLIPAPLGEFIISTGEVLRAGRKTIFVRGVISAKERAVLSFSGSLQRF